MDLSPIEITACRHTCRVGVLGVNKPALTVQTTPPRHLSIYRSISSTACRQKKINIRRKPELTFSFNAAVVVAAVGVVDDALGGEPTGVLNVSICLADIGNVGPVGAVAVHVGTGPCRRRGKHWEIVYTIAVVGVIRLWYVHCTSIRFSSLCRRNMSTDVFDLRKGQDNMSVGRRDFSSVVRGKKWSLLPAF